MKKVLFFLAVFSIQVSSALAQTETLPPVFPLQKKLLSGQLTEASLGSVYSWSGRPIKIDDQGNIFATVSYNRPQTYVPIDPYLSKIKPDGSIELLSQDPYLRNCIGLYDRCNNSGGPGAFGVNSGGNHIYYVWSDGSGILSPNFAYVSKIYDAVTHSVYFDLTSSRYYPSFEIKVNNHGTALVSYSKLTGSIWSYHYGLIDKDGQFSPLNIPSDRQTFATDLNDLGTVFVAHSNSAGGIDIYSINNGVQRKVVTVTGQSLGSAAFFASSISSDAHPEGILYYIQANQKIVGTDGSIALDLSSTSQRISQFSMNNNKQLIFTIIGQDGMESVFAVKDRVIHPVVGPGSSLNGKSVRSAAGTSMNSKGDFVVNVRFMDGSSGIYSAGVDNQKPIVMIDEFRVAQTVFEPSATSGVSYDLITKKPYAV